MSVSCKKFTMKWRKWQKVVRKTDHSRKGVSLRVRRERGMREPINFA